MARFGNGRPREETPFLTGSLPWAEEWQELGD